MQQKVCTGNAVVKPGKLYVVQAQIGKPFGEILTSWGHQRNLRVERLSLRVILDLDE